MTKNDPVNHPSHYADHYEHEVIELTEKLDFCLGNAVKYILRAPYKGHEAEDLKKARWYVNRMVERGWNFNSLFSSYKKEDMELLGSFSNDLVYELVFNAANTAKLDGIIEKLNYLILQAENRELKKQLKDAEDKAFLEAARLATTLPRRPSDLDTIKFWMTGYAI